MKTLVLFLFHMLFTTNIFSQWTLDTSLHMYYNHPYPMRISVVDSSVSWLLCGVYENPIPFYPCFAKRTVNGWKMLYNTDLDSNLEGRSIYARDSNTAWIGTGRPEAIYFTSNGGYNWALQCYISDTAHVEEIMFSKKYPNIGYAFAEFNYQGYWNGCRILKTTNSGLNWTRWDFSYLNFCCAQNSMSVIDSNYAWFGLWNFYGLSKIIMTSTGGITWNIVDVNGGFAGADDIQFSSDGQTGLYIASDNITRIYRTTNSGINWYNIYSISNYSYFYTVRWITETCNIYAHTSDYVMRSVNNGLNWSNMTGINSTQLCTMDAVRINSGTIYALAVNLNGEVYKLLDTIRPIGIENHGEIIPQKYELYQNYPNPFNPVTIIKFDLPENASVTIKIYDVLGRVVDILAKDESKKAGSYNVIWNASNFPSGVYFCRLGAVGFVSSKKMILIK